MKRTVTLEPACFLESDFRLSVIGGMCVLPNDTEFEGQKRDRRRAIRGGNITLNLYGK